MLAVGIVIRGGRSGLGDTSRCRPSPTTGHTGHVPGGSIGLSLGRNIEAGKTEGVEIRIWERLLGGRMAGHAPDPGRRAGSNRRVELRHATAPQFLEAVGAIPPLPPKIRT